jgi:hypothetical protein
MTVSVRPPAGATRGPWFRERPTVALTVAAALFVAVLCLRLLAGGPVEAYSMLYALPVALIATSSGVRAGTAAGLVAVALMVLWAAAMDVSLSPAGWASRVVPMLLLGVLLGDASDRWSRADTERRRLESAALLHREAIEINDSLVQGMVAAKWSLEAGQTDVGLRTLSETITRAHGLVSELIRRADMGSHSDHLDQR